MGNTGVGKSTTINFLLGLKMVMYVPDDADDAQEDDPDPFAEYGSPLKKVLSAIRPEGGPKAKIGHKLGESMTSMIHAYEHKATELVLCDIPGFGDFGKLDGPSGYTLDVANAVAISKLAKRARSLRIVLLIDSRSLATNRPGRDRGELLQECLELVMQMM